jgi:predicted ATPase
LHFLHGELLLSGLEPGPHTEAEGEAAYLLAIEIAQEQEARFLELRAAMSLAKLWVAQGQRERAYELLKPLLEWFTEGWDSPILQNAKALLATLE